MRIDHLRLENFRGFQSLEIDLHPQCTVLVGTNGSGKSSVLDGLTVALGAWFLGFNEVSTRSILPDEIHRRRFETEGYINLEPQYPVRVEAEGVVEGERLSWARELRSKGGNTTYGEASLIREVSARVQSAVQASEAVTLPVVASYGTARLWVQKRKSEQKRLGLTSRTLGYQDCLDPESNHKLFESWMRQQEQARLQKLSRHPNRIQSRQLEESSLLQAVSKAAGECVEEGAYLYFDLASDELRFVDQGKERPFSLLSDGYRNLVALAGDIAWRMVRLNPHLGADAPKLTPGVVLIDEIALHLHPAWQRSVLRNLQRAFPKVQFIVSTHSPQVLGGVPAECIRHLSRDGEVARVSAAEGLDSNTILRDLMGVPERDPAFTRRLENVDDLIEASSFEEARAELKALAQILRPDDPAITGLEWELAMAQPGGRDPLPSASGQALRTALCAEHYLRRKLEGRGLL